MAPAGHGGITGITFDSDGHRLVGVAYLARGHHPKPTALLLHGCPGLEQNLDVAAMLRDRGWNAVVFHYRGCWGSAGRYDLRTIGRDVRAAVDHLQAGGYPGVDPDRIVVIGHSLGGWAAIPAVEVDREFTRFLAMTPAEFLSQRDEVGTRPGPLDVVASISPRPLLVIHGSDDEWVRADQGRRLYQQAKEPRRYVEIDGANHAFAWHRAVLREQISGWLAETDALGGTQ